MHTLPLQLVTAQSYYQALLCEIPRAKRRIVIHAMVVLWGGKTKLLVPLLESALRRGVEVRIVSDIFSKFEARTAKIAKRGPYLSWKHTQEINCQLTDAGAAITYVGKLQLNPFGGRCHSKITVLDDTVYTFGGVNVTNSHFTYRDLMVKAEDAALADRLCRLVHDIADGQSLSNLTERLDAQTTLLFDSGIPGKSVIYDTACSIITEAQKVYFISKMCPSGQLARLLQNTKHACYFNRPNLEGLPANLAIMADQARYHIMNQYTRTHHIHAKFILTENKDGSRHILSGSNNFSWRGIAYGTKEIAVHSTDPALWQEFYHFLESEIM